MNRRAVILCCHLIFALPLLARESTDVLVMKNGDHLTCEIKGMNGGVLYVGLPYVIQTLSVDWSQVAHLESKQLFLVKTEDGAVYRGVINSAKAPDGRTIEIQEAVAPEKKVVLESARIVTVSATSERLFQRFTGGVNFGTIYSKGNQTAQYNISGFAGYPRDRWAAQASLSSSLSTASGTSTTTRNQLAFAGMHLLPWNNYFYGGIDSFLQSTEQGIAGQNTMGFGVGRYLKNTNRTVINVLGGGAWQNTHYNPTIFAITTQNVATALINTQVKLFRFNKTNLDLNATLLPALSEPGRVYFSTNASYYIKIIGNLSWNVSFYGNWDSHPPGNLPGSDYGTSSGLSWTFGTSLRIRLSRPSSTDQPLRSKMAQAAPSTVCRHPQQPEFTRLDWHLPCADCPGTKTWLTLNFDGSCRLVIQPQGSQNAEKSRPSGNAITLDERGGRQQFSAGEGRLTLLSPQGCPSVTTLKPAMESGRGLDCFTLPIWNFARRRVRRWCS